MSRKKVFALRLDPEMLAALERWADDEFRSINGQIEYLLFEALRKAGRLPARNKPGVNSGSENEKSGNTTYPSSD